MSFVWDSSSLSVRIKAAESSWSHVGQLQTFTLFEQHRAVGTEMRLCCCLRLHHFLSFRFSAAAFQLGEATALVGGALEQQQQMDDLIKEENVYIYFE